MEVTLLGTGNPRPTVERAGPSQHLQLGQSSVLVDCGSGVARRMLEGGLSIEAIDYLFLTHQHSDHTVDLAHLLISRWVMGRAEPLTIFVPPGIQEFVRRVLYAFEVDIKARSLGRPTPLSVDVHEVTTGEVLKTPDWRALCFLVDHGPLLPGEPYLGYRFEDDAHKVVISGDTVPCDAVADAAKGADLLIHELNVSSPSRDPHDNPELPAGERRVASGHTCPHDVGRIAAAAGVPRLVLSHLSPATDTAWIQDAVGKDYDGELVVGKDLLAIGP